MTNDLKRFLHLKYCDRLYKSRKSEKNCIHTSGGGVSFLNLYFDIFSKVAQNNARSLKKGCNFQTNKLE